jgi:hypothetical protein
MIDDNKINKSILPIGYKGLVRVGNSIDVTKKIISQGTVLESNYSKIRIIPFMKSDGYYLLDKGTNLLGKGPYKSITRNREFMICLDFNNNYTVLRNDLLLFQFSNFGQNVFHFYSPDFSPPFVIIENKYIVIYFYRASYGLLHEGWKIEIEGVFDFEGNKIEYPLTKYELEEIINDESKDDLKISETLWKINRTTLNFKNDIILNIEDILEISVSDFHYGYARVKEVADCCLEYGEMSSDIGYIDVYGNIYWEPGLKYGSAWERANEQINDKMEPLDEKDLPF